MTLLLKGQAFNNDPDSSRLLGDNAVPIGWKFVDLSNSASLTDITNTNNVSEIFDGGSTESTTTANPLLVSTQTICPKKPEIALDSVTKTVANKENKVSSNISTNEINGNLQNLLK
jgi:hypothetical protein